MTAKCLIVALAACGGSSSRPDAAPADAPRARDAALDAAPDAAHVDMLQMTVDGTPHMYRGDEAKFYFDQASNRFNIEATQTTGNTTTFLAILLPHDITGPTTITACDSLADKEMDWFTSPPGIQFSAGGNPGTSCMLELTAFGGVGSDIEGTFKGVLISSSSQLVSLNNGVFSIKRGLDH